MDELIDNLAYELFSILLVVFFVLILYVIAKRRFDKNDESNGEH